MARETLKFRREPRPPGYRRRAANLGLPDCYDIEVGKPANCIMLDYANDRDAVAH